MALLLLLTSCTGRPRGCLRAGMQIGVSVAQMFSLLGGIFMSFGPMYNFRTWPIALVAMGSVPLVAISGALQMKVMMGGQEESKSGQEAGQLVTDAVSSIRTVRACGAETVALRKYRVKQFEPLAAALKQSVISGIVFGFTNLCMYSSFSIIFFYGIYVQGNPCKVYSQKPTDNPPCEPRDPASVLGSEEIMTSVMCIMMGAMGAGQATLTLGDIGKAKLAAYRLFKVIDRKSLIDPEQSGAIVSAVKEIAFESVSFAYPARVDAKVTKELSFVARQGMPLLGWGDGGV